LGTASSTHVFLNLIYVSLALFSLLYLMRFVIIYLEQPKVHVSLHRLREPWVVRTTLLGYHSQQSSFYHLIDIIEQELVILYPLSNPTTGFAQHHQTWVVVLVATPHRTLKSVGVK